MKHVEWKFAGRLLTVQLILFALTQMMVPGLLNLMPDNAAVQWTGMIVICTVCYVFLFLDCMVKGSKDVSMDEISRKQNERAGKDPEDFVHAFQPMKGLVNAVLVQIPLVLAALVLGILQLTGVPSAIWMEAGMRMLYILIAQVFTLFERVPAVIFLVPMALFVLFSWWGYCTGLSQRRRMNLVIKRNTERLARRQAIKKGRNKRK